MLDRRARLIAWSLVALNAAVLAAATTLLVFNRRFEAPGGFLGAVLPLAIGLIYPSLAAVVATRQPRNAITWILLGLGLTMSITLLGDEYAIQGELGPSGPLPGAGVAAWLQSWTTASFFVTGFPLLFLLFPDGRVPSPRWRPVFGVIALSFLVKNALAIFASGPLTASFEGIGLGLGNPSGLYDPRSAGAEAQILGVAVWLIYAFALLTCVAALVVRLLRTQGAEKQQMKWLAYVAALLVVALMANLAARAVHQPGIAQLAFGFAVLTVAAGVPAATVIALMRYHLYGIDIVISRTVVVGGMAVFITILYLAIVTGLGSLIDVGTRANLALSLVATAVIAVAFQQVREWLQATANRIAYGHDASPYEVLTQFSREIAASSNDDETLAHVARVLVDGLSASRAEIWIRVESRLVRAAAWPDSDDGGGRELEISAVKTTGIPESDHVVWVGQQPDPLGALAIKMTAGTHLFPVETRLLNDLAVHMAVVLRNIGLAVALSERLTELNRQQLELRRSRQAVVEAHDRERRRLERNIHDGAQQHIVALVINLRLAAKAVATKPDQLAGSLEELRAEAAETLAVLDELSSGGQPAALRDQGLVPALRSQAQQLPMTVTVEGQLSGRFDAQVETAVYFTCLEALQNAIKHAGATRVGVWLGSTVDELRFSITDDGAGFDASGATDGSGLRNMRERLASVAGALTVRSGSGAGGTVVSGTIPLAALATSA